MKEILHQTPSQFVLVMDGHEKRLNSGEKVKLGLATPPDHEELLSFTVTVANDYVKMNFQYTTSFVVTEWGNVITKMGTKEKEFTTTFSSSSLNHRDERVEIQGTDLYFNSTFTKLSGSGWSLEYCP